MARVFGSGLPSFSTYFYLIVLSKQMGAQYLVPVLSMVDILDKQNKNALIERFTEQFLDLDERSEHMDKLKVAYGSSLLAQGKEIKKAETFLLRALQLQDSKYGEASEVSMRTLMNLGALYAKIGDANSSIKYYTRGLPKQELSEGRDSTFVFHTVYQLGVQYCIIGEYETSKGYFERALALNEKWRPKGVPGIDKAVCSDILENLAAIYDSQGEPEKAAEFNGRAKLMK
eukprot:CAMPEP_0206183814 /NCGR_PEP_ID=MMETSP0166-20121206/859_1 /ASSEMBLY_ACC=CAM_ASM_000260 /TAXON_ID=95228 /ORGANISM="Vannella robusta, Strain DIVA3 518/3/11/1/6" /LENGTH=229 /DNA_ID=CAMNT_0053598735 /DNA_START=132 /DNA_END=821 /DNA_ORIENTATION=-